jgi:glycosyltransferase involved in cell wall biosynthesis
MYASRLLGTWPSASSVVDRFLFLWESDRQCAIAAGLPEAACALVRHPFDPFYLDRGPASLGPRLSRLLPSVARRIVFSGPPEATRGVDDVVRLVDTLPGDLVTQVVLLLRDPRFHEPVVEHARRGSHDLVWIRGLLSRDEIRAIYHESHVAVFPYRFVRTGLPLVALEAVAAGLPVVTTRVHPIRELEGGTGLVFAKPRDPRDLARAVRLCFDDDQQESIRRENEKWIQTSPEWRTVAKTVVSIGRGA